MGRQQWMRRCALEESLRDLMMYPDLQNDTFTITNVGMWINFLVLCCYIRKTKLVPPIAMNLLWIVNSEGKSDKLHAGNQIGVCIAIKI